MTSMTLTYDERPVTARWPLNIAGRRVEDSETLVLTCSEPGGFTVEDLEEVPVTWHCKELIEGELIVSASPSRLHQFASRAMFRLLDHACPPHLEVYFSALDVTMGESKPQPDLLVVPLAPLHVPVETPLVCVEVLSPNSHTNDLRRKRRLYAASGVQHYWILDPLEPSLLVLRLDGGGYRQVAHVSGPTAYDAVEPFAVRIVATELVTQRPGTQVGG